MSSGLDKQIYEEAIKSKRALHSARQRLCWLAGMYPGQFQLPLNFTPVVHGGLRRLSCAELKSEYELISSTILPRRASQVERQKTMAEREVHKRILNETHKQLHTSVLIGAHFADLFIPNVRSDDTGKVMRGLVIEVDGDVHNYESKMRKDEVKGLCFKMIGIGVTSIPNHELDEPTISQLLRQIRNLRPLDSRDRSRLWSRIYGLTLAIHTSDSEFISIFSNQSGGQGI